MASAQLPAPTLTAAERDDIVARFGGTDEYLAAFTAWLYGEVERRAAAEAREVANAAIAAAVEQVKVDLPVSIVGESVKASLEVVEAAALDEAKVTGVSVKG